MEYAIKHKSSLHMRGDIETGEILPDGTLSITHTYSDGITHNHTITPDDTVIIFRDGEQRTKISAGQGYYDMMRKRTQYLASLQAG